jgi:organic hydroperoxide reductase OsmC/OhrA
MSEHKATIRWTRKATPDDFAKGKYSREHTWSFDGGVTVPASASPSVVPAPWSNPASVDPEEAYVASISSCHMLTFLYVAQKKGFVVESYEDQAVGVMTKSERGATPWVSAVTLHPTIVYGGEKKPTAADEEHLHHEAHEQCFIAQSVKTEITVKRSA